MMQIAGVYRPSIRSARSVTGELRKNERSELSSLTKSVEDSLNKVNTMREQTRRSRDFLHQGEPAARDLRAHRMVESRLREELESVKKRSLDRLETLQRLLEQKERTIKAQEKIIVRQNADIEELRYMSDNYASHVDRCQHRIGELEKVLSEARAAAVAPPVADKHVQCELQSTADVEQLLQMAGNFASQVNVWKHRIEELEKLLADVRAAADKHVQCELKDKSDVDELIFIADSYASHVDVAQQRIKELEKLVAEAHAPVVAPPVADEFMQRELKYKSDIDGLIFIADSYALHVDVAQQRIKELEKLLAMAHAEAVAPPVADKHVQCELLRTSDVEHLILMAGKFNSQMNAWKQRIEELEKLLAEARVAAAAPSVENELKHEAEQDIKAEAKARQIKVSYLREEHQSLNDKMKGIKELLSTASKYALDIEAHQQRIKELEEVLAEAPSVEDEIQCEGVEKEEMMIQGKKRYSAGH